MRSSCINVACWAPNYFGSTLGAPDFLETPTWRFILVRPQRSLDYPSRCLANDSLRPAAQVRAPGFFVSFQRAHRPLDAAQIQIHLDSAGARDLTKTTGLRQR